MKTLLALFAVALISACGQKTDDKTPAAVHAQAESARDRAAVAGEVAARAFAEQKLEVVRLTPEKNQK